MGQRGTVLVAPGVEEVANKIVDSATVVGLVASGTILSSSSIPVKSLRNSSEVIIFPTVLLRIVLSRSKLYCQGILCSQACHKRCAYSFDGLLSSLS